MTQTIYLALTHDWELRGDGSGDIEEIQFAPLRRLLAIYEKAGARTTFLPDVMQQLRFRSLQDEHPELKRAADSWDEHAQEAYARGHDIQLHLHSQWSNVEYENGRWQLRGDWSLLNYDQDMATKMISDSRSYLENALHPVDPQYRCVAFRASALALAPSAHLLSSLAALGIEIDVSVAGGVYLNNDTLQLDYRTCEEGFLPYYPRMDDARRISNQQEPIVCVPLNHFYGSRRLVTKQNLALAKARFSSTEKTTAGPARLDSQSTGLARVYEKLIAPAIKRKHFVSDTGRLNYPLMCEMLASIRQRARESGLAKVPVVLTNHPKDIRDWAGLERFVGEVADAPDLKFITLSELAEKIRSGEFRVRTAETSHR
ncbi:MAG TPA: hypothetical protein DC054_26285 [Blastocatellia bacterium]|nr:hypothetical protein [Blastocatellia bacterium]